MNFCIWQKVVFAICQQDFGKTATCKDVSSYCWPSFSVTPLKIDLNKNQNRLIDKVQNLGNERS